MESWEPSRGLLIVGHGTRDSQGVRAFLETVGQLAQALPEAAVEPCFLEFVHPTIGGGVERLVNRAIRRIVVVPLMLFAAGHVRRDIPTAVRRAAAFYPHLELTLARHLGCPRGLVNLSERRFQQALGGRPEIAPEQTGLVLVGRGSDDPGATAEMKEFARIYRQVAPVAWMEVGFLDMARPSLAETLATVAARPVRRIVVQPHLLFPGLLVRSVRRMVDDYARESREIDWVMTEPLGPDPLLVEAVVSAARGLASVGGTAGRAQP